MKKKYVAVIIAATLDGRAFIAKEYKGSSKKECKTWLEINAVFTEIKLKRPVATAIVETPNTL